MLKKFSLIGILVLVAMLAATPPSGGGRTLIFSTFSGGGEELSPAVGGDFAEYGIFGRGISAGSWRAEGSDFHLYGGFRFVDLDLRAPITTLDAGEDTSSSAMFFVEWYGADTTAEDGEGWGIRYHDVQWSSSAEPGVWYDWYTFTSRTNAWFGPTEPTVVESGVRYYFRTRAADLVDNIEMWPEMPDDSTIFEDTPLFYTVYQLLDGDSLWDIPDTLDIGDYRATAPNERFEIRNYGVDSLDIGLYAFNTEEWMLGDEPGRDTYSLRAIMNDDGITPSDEEFDSESNIVRATRDGIRWATLGEGGIFGTGGRLRPFYRPRVEAYESLWLQVRTPTQVTRYGGYDDEMIHIKVEARAAIY